MYIFIAKLFYVNVLFVIKISQDFAVVFCSLCSKLVAKYFYVPSFTNL